MKEEFKTIDELYQRVLPALKSKTKEFKKKKKDINEEEIWNVLSKYKWIDSVNLTLFDIVDDILKLTITDFNNYKSRE